MKRNTHIEELLASYIAGELSEEEKLEVKSWMEEDPDHRKYFQELKTTYQLGKISQKPSGFDPEAGWSRVKSAYYQTLYTEERKSTNLEKKRVLRRIISVAAAAVVIAFFIGFFTQNVLLHDVESTGNVMLSEVVVPLGSTTTLSLPDGSHVTLNAGTRLRYDPGAFADTRLVRLEGEAYFDVDHDAGSQFIVRTSEIDVKVYGTTFNVKAYAEESKITTTLVSGKVALESHAEGSSRQTVFLSPSQNAVYTKTDDAGIGIQDLAKQMKIETGVNPIYYTSWKDKRWVIGGETLEELAVKLERKFNVHFVFENEAVKKYKFSGPFVEETFEQVMDIVEAALPIKYHVQNNTVTLTIDEEYREEYDRMLLNSQRNGNN